MYSRATGSLIVPVTEKVAPLTTFGENRTEDRAAPRKTATARRQDVVQLSEESQAVVNHARAENGMRRSTTDDMTLGETDFSVGAFVVGAAPVHDEVRRSRASGGLRGATVA